MEILYSQIPPMVVKPGKKRFLDVFDAYWEKADHIEIATGYASKRALLVLADRLSQEADKTVHINLGMYYLEGMPEGMYHKALEIHQRWETEGCGAIRLVRSMKYHGKIYVFYHKSQPFAAIIGSHNLGTIQLDASNRRQYEISALIEEPPEVLELDSFVKDLWNRCAADISQLTNIPLITEPNTALDGVQEIKQLPEMSVELYKMHRTGISFELPLKVPAFADRFKTGKQYYTKSNLNVAYARPRSNNKSRDWYEFQLTVSKKIREQEGYPEKDHPFFVVTDDGYWFKAHTTSDNNKQFSAVGNELLLGRWIKGRLAAAGLVSPVNDTQKDTERLGMITKEMLAAYGRNTLIFTKTDQKAVDHETDEAGNPVNKELDVWILSFEAKKEKTE